MKLKVGHFYITSAKYLPLSTLEVGCYRGTARCKCSQRSEHNSAQNPCLHHNARELSRLGQNTTICQNRSKSSQTFMKAKESGEKTHFEVWSSNMTPWAHICPQKPGFPTMTLNCTSYIPKRTSRSFRILELCTVRWYNYLRFGEY